jgi:hypothetical protein
MGHALTWGTDRRFAAFYGGTVVFSMLAGCLVVRNRFERFVGSAVASPDSARQCQTVPDSARQCQTRPQAGHDEIVTCISLRKNHR